MHPVDLASDPSTRHVVRVVEGEADDLDNRCAGLLEEMVGIRLECWGILLVCVAWAESSPCC